ncbi:MAG TPA: PIN domain nuclease [Acetobacteraceae bacterium]|nr:PIN domain nuclease [Acetobacteraceae bacterium]
MILVDSSVWIANLRGARTEAVRKLHALYQADERILIGDLILMEIMMGARDEAQAIRLRREMGEFQIVPLMDVSMAEEAARNHRILRGLGFTIRTGIDMVIGTYCIRHGHELLHDDRDFDPMQRHLGLRVA